MTDHIVQLQGGDLEAAREVLQEGIEDIVGAMNAGGFDLWLLGQLQDRAGVWDKLGPPAWHPDGAYRTAAREEYGFDEVRPDGQLDQRQVDVLQEAAEEAERRAADSLEDAERVDDWPPRITHYRRKLEAAQRVQRALSHPNLQLVPPGAGA
jgi:hypothetical protein